MNKFFSYLTAICFLVVFNSPVTCLETYSKNPHVEQEIWDSLSPYFLPVDHPIKKKLDKIFAERVTANVESVKKAGFSTPEHRKVSLTIVSKHPSINGYLVKMFTDDQDICEWDEFLYRIEGAQLAREIIDEYKYQNFFDVPQKYIYPLPAEPSPAEECHRKNFILVVQDMNIVSRKENRLRWASTCSCELLHALFDVLESGGFADCVISSNLPFSKKTGKIVFIDTEEYNWWPIDYSRFNYCLSPEMKKYWINLTQKDVPIGELKLDSESSVYSSSDDE